jgi:hypothetical protein
MTLKIAVLAPIPSAGRFLAGFSADPQDEAGRLSEDYRTYNTFRLGGLRRV